MQSFIGVFFIVIVLSVVAVFSWVALSTRYPTAYPVAAALSRARRIWAIILGMLLVALFAFSISRLPYPWAKGFMPMKVVEVQAMQFGWQIEPRQLSRGTTVEFHVTAKDINHGFGVYNPSGQLLGQTQAMPTYTNRLILTLNQPGTYTVRCLEFCGVGHHLMNATFEVGGN